VVQQARAGVAAGIAKGSDPYRHQRQSSARSAPRRAAGDGAARAGDAGVDAEGLAALGAIDKLSIGYRVRQKRRATRGRCDRAARRRSQGAQARRTSARVPAVKDADLEHFRARARDDMVRLLAAADQQKALEPERKGRA
jgi:hypothetical protein